MGKEVVTNEKYSVGLLFIIIPTIMLIFSYFFIPYPFTADTELFLFIPMFLGLFLLGIGFFIKKIPLGNNLKTLGWIVFAFYWSTQPTKLYVSEGNDIFNGVVCVIGVFVLFYFAYHEWLCTKRNENISCLNWIAGASSLSGIIYFGIENLVIPIGSNGIIVKEYLIELVADHSAKVLDAIIGNAELVVVNSKYNIHLDGNYAVTIIFACTAIQAMVIFIGMIIALPKISIKRKIIGLLITLIPIYILNLLRNAMVAFLLGRNITNFFWAHNVLSKIGALITLIVLLIILIKIIPEILDEIFCLSDLYKRKGPIEKSFSKVFGRKK
jgi:archaeosortase A (PGF-CTERM-specific)